MIGGQHRPVWQKQNLCVMCQQPLPPDRSAQADLCYNPVCQTRKRVRDAGELAKKQTAQKAKYFEVSKRRTRQVIKQAAKEIGQPHLGKVAFGIAPYIDVPLTPLPPERRRAFEDHLRNVVAESFAKAELPNDPPEDDPDYAKRQADELPEPFVINATCIACQGDCCLMGGTRHAFLEVRTIDYLRWRSPDLTEQQVIEYYLSHIPEITTAQSCVFHGEQGCTLDRSFRADICNNFQCWARQALIKEHARKPLNGAVVAGVPRDHVDSPEAGAPCLKVVSITAEDEVQVHSHLKLPALRKGM